MSEPRRWNLVAEGLILAVSGGPSVSFQEAEKGIPVIEAEPILARLKELEVQLKEANEVAEFYGGTDCYAVVTADGQVDGFSEEEPGKRARAYLKKWEEK